MSLSNDQQILIKLKVRTITCRDTLIWAIYYVCYDFELWLSYHACIMHGIVARQAWPL